MVIGGIGASQTGAVITEEINSSLSLFLFLSLVLPLIECWEFAEEFVNLVIVSLFSSRYGCDILVCVCCWGVFGVCWCSLVEVEMPSVSIRHGVRLPICADTGGSPGCGGSGGTW